MMNRIILVLIIFISVSTANAQRIKTSINSNWLFCKGDTLKSAWEKVSLPHTWNAKDVMDDEPGYYRGEGWYKKRLFIPPSWKGKTIHLYFEGANQVATVFVNGKDAGEHIGGYTAFSFPIQSLLNFDSTATNEVVVKLTNAHNENIPPLGADFSFYGGIYRDVYLLATDAIHFDLDNHASSDVFISTPKVSDAAAEVNVKGVVSNTSLQAQKLQVQSVVYDDAGKVIVQKKIGLDVKGGSSANFEGVLPAIASPKLWSPDAPSLYTVVTTILNKKGEVLDEIANPLGFRWFRFDADSGFYLNGKHLKLMGANRHQDFKSLGNALPDALHLRDMELLKGMGANFIRIAHYPQDPAILQACDRLGLLAMEEIPIVNRITQTDSFASNCLQMQTEMIRQHYNHPSIIIWAYMNEVLIQPRYDRGSTQQETYFKDLVALAQRIENLTRTEDSSRYTCIPNFGNYDIHIRTGLINVPQIIGWNLYQGWYEGSFDGFGKFMDRYHTEVKKPTIITEYGADCDVRLHSFNPLKFDKTMEYATLYHQSYLKQMMERPYIAGGAAWNFVEFNAEARQEATPHMNTKGLVTADRTPKDAYWLYKAWLAKEPVVTIGSREWKLRSGIAVSNDSAYCLQPVEVYTNQPSVTAYLNGKQLNRVEAIDHICRFNIPFVDGMNKLEMRADNGTSDATDIEFALQPATYTKASTFKNLYISLGDQRQLSDVSMYTVWLPEKQYSKGSWGYVGGEVYKMKHTDRLPYGSDKNIFNTDLNAVYETQRVSIDAFKADVPDGRYSVVLHFAELLSDKEQETLLYNLGRDGKQEKASERIFDVLVNGQPVWKGLSNKKELLPQYAYQTATDVIVEGGKGITVSFVPVKGQTILNAIEIIRL